MWGKLVIAALIAAAPFTPALADDDRRDRHGWREHRGHDDGRWHHWKKGWDRGDRWKHKRYAWRDRDRWRHRRHDYHHHHHYDRRRYGYLFNYWYPLPSYSYYRPRYAYRDPWEYCWKRRYRYTDFCRWFRYEHGW